MSGFSLPGRFFDGETAGEKAVRGFVDTEAWVLRIKVSTNEEIAVWPLSSLRKIKDPGYRDGVVFQLADSHEDAARFIVQYGEDAEALVELVPEAKKTDVARGTYRKVLLWTTGAVGAILLMLFVILPNLADTLAGIIPPEREEAIGETIVAQMQRTLLGQSETDTFCTSPEGTAALQKMTDRLAGDLDLPYALKVKVLDHPMVNAFAAPGGHVIFMEGLIERADGPDEVAGVLAHEIGHVAARDPLRIALRAAGSAGIVSMVIGDFAGGAAVVLMTEWLMQASYTREAEAQADAFAHKMLADAGLPSEGLATFFDKLLKQYGDVEGVSELLSSHPSLAGRSEAAREAETRAGSSDYRPVLSDSEWAALQAICD